MKSILRNSGLLLVLIIGLCSAANAQYNRKANRDTREWRYEIEAMGTGVQGTYLIKVWTYSQRPNVAIEQAKKNAVHGIIFRGFSGKPGIPGQRALTNNVNLEQEKAEFFDPFFADGGKYMKFVSITNDGSVGAGDRLRVGKEYKIGVIVSVNVAALRDDLENAGMLKGLSSGF
jgi:hypothetical protein